MDGLVGGWVSGSKREITNNLIKLGLIEIIRFYLKIYDLWTHSPLLDRCMGGWLGGSVGRLTSNH